MVADLEKWKNASASGHVLKRRFDDGWKDETVRGHAEFMLTESERVYNQSRITNRDYDPFTNGRFEPVQLIEDAEGVDAIRDSPNVISASEVERLVHEVPSDVLADRLNGFTAPEVVRRLFNEAVDNGASDGRVRLIEARLVEIDPVAVRKGKSRRVKDADPNDLFNSGPGDVPLSPTVLPGVTELERI